MSMATHIAIDPRLVPIHERFHRRNPLEDLVRANMDAFVRLISRQREELGLSQRKASDLCDLGPMTFNHVEGRVYMPSESVMADMLHGLGLTRADLLAEIRAMEDEEARDEAA